MDKLDLAIADDPILSLFSEITDGGKEDSINMTGRSNSGYAHVKTPGQKANLTAPVEEDQMLKNFFTIAERQNVEWEAYVHDKYSLVKDTSEELIEKVFNTIYLALTHQIFNFSTASTVTLPGAYSYDLKTPDAVAYISASHTTPSGLTDLTNIGGTGNLSIQNLTTNIGVGQQNMKDSNGNTIAYTPDMLIVPNFQPMVEKGKQITGSTLVESSGNNAINVYSGGTMKLVVLKRAPFDEMGQFDTTKQYRWSTADSKLLKKSLKYKWAARPTLVGRFMDQENFDSSYGVAARFGFGACRWQGIVQNNSTTAPTTSA
jgi:hypothetical protein